MVLRKESSHGQNLGFGVKLSSLSNLSQGASDGPDLVPLIEVKLDPPLVGHVPLPWLHNEQDHTVRLPIVLEGLAQTISKAVNGLVLRQLSVSKVSIKMTAELIIKRVDKKEKDYGGKEEI